MTGKQYRELAAKHRTLEQLYSRLAAKQELHDSLNRYGTRLDEVAKEIVELEREIRELERPPVVVSVPPRARGG